MAATDLVDAYYDTYTRQQIFDRRKDCLEARGNPESLTSDSQSEVALGFQPKTQAELLEVIRIFNAVIARFDAGVDGEEPQLESRSRYIHLHNRPIE